MSSITTSTSPDARPGERLEALFAELSELTGQRNAIDGRIVEIVAEIDHDQLRMPVRESVLRRCSLNCRS
ncbi:hypothetical protein H7J07_12985 [Mycobacterium koreense]|nr:hypothetical protein [Mycolicibacillus koreensis]